VGRLEAPRFVVHGAGKGALDVAEQLTFQQAFAERPAIDTDIGPVRTGAQAMNGPRNQLLARAGFAH